MVESESGSNQLGRVPREAGAEADPQGAGPVLEPVDRAVELEPDLGGYSVMSFRWSETCCFQAGSLYSQEPLVVEDLDFDPVAAAADDRADVELVHDLRSRTSRSSGPRPRPGPPAPACRRTCRRVFLSRTRPSKSPA